MKYVAEHGVLTAKEMFFKKIGITVSGNIIQGLNVSTKEMSCKLKAEEEDTIEKELLLKKEVNC